MSGIVGSYFNTRGSGVVAKLGSDGQVFTSTGAGLSQGFEAAPGGGKIGQVIMAEDKTTRSTTGTTAYSDMSSTLVGVITPSATTSKILVICSTGFQSSTYSWSATLYRDIAGGGYTNLTDAGTYNAFVEAAGAAQNIHATMVYLDSPSTTSECSYRPYGSIGSALGTLNMNNSNTHGTITVMEVLA